VTGERPDSSRTEIRIAFDNLQAVLSAGGMSLDCVVKVEVALSDLMLRAEVNEVWEELFPAEDDRPVRHTTHGQLPGNLRVQLTVTAIDE
jgi:2-iminobutanoate/2-iminopropanoate deaminase